MGVTRRLPAHNVHASSARELTESNVCLFSTWKGLDWAVWLRSFGYAIFDQPKMWVDALILLSWNVSYQGLYDLTYTLHNPFLDRRLDVAHETISGGIRNLASSLMDGVPYLPPALVTELGLPQQPARKAGPGAVPVGDAGVSLSAVYA